MSREMAQQLAQAVPPENLGSLSSIHTEFTIICDFSSWGSKALFGLYGYRMVHMHMQANKTE